MSHRTLYVTTEIFPEMKTSEFFVFPCEVQIENNVKHEICRLHLKEKTININIFPLGPLICRSSSRSTISAFSLNTFFFPFSSSSSSVLCMENYWKIRSIKCSWLDLKGFLVFRELLLLRLPKLHVTQVENLWEDGAIGMAYYIPHHLFPQSLYLTRKYMHPGKSSSGSSAPFNIFQEKSLMAVIVER